MTEELKTLKDLTHLEYKDYDSEDPLAKPEDSVWINELRQEAIKRYIQEQEGKDVFEYDIYNCPKELKGQLKIGDFSC